MSIETELHAPAYVQRAATRMAMIAVHELGALSAHYNELRERLAVARRARSTGELLRDQMDLFAETQSRLRHDHQVRRELLRRWIRTLNPV